LQKGIKVGFLSQTDDFGDAKTVKDFLFHSDNELALAVYNYEKSLEGDFDTDVMQSAYEEMDRLNAWGFEAKVKQVLQNLRISGYLEKELEFLSGGQKKRVSLAKLLLDKKDFLILDEPTNHLDLDMIDWLEDYFAKEKITLFMVTHDRYFLDRVCNTIMELDDGKIRKYVGNYSYFLEKKSEREENERLEAASAMNLYRQELKWIVKQPRARETKSKSRSAAFYELQEKVSVKKLNAKLELDLVGRRIGSKVVKFENVSKKFGTLSVLEDFSYEFSHMDRIGIVGDNGVGKTTFLNMLIGDLEVDSGNIEIGKTVVFAYFKQAGCFFDESKRVIDVVKDVADFIPLSDGRKLSAAKMLERFLFPPTLQYSLVSKLSGGEKKRLYLLTLLMKNPNFLILDEPTNDFDILTVNVLEGFLLDFSGCLVVVSHDRYFMDKLVNKLFIFEGAGVITQYSATYSEYRAYKEFKDNEVGGMEEWLKNEEVKDDKSGLSFKEQKKIKNEISKLERDIEKIKNKKAEISKKLDVAGLPYEDIQKLSDEFNVLNDKMDAAEERWLELSA